MLGFYIFCFVVGGGFLLLSVLGDVFGGGGDIDLLGADVDVGGITEALDGVDSMEVDLADAGDAASAYKIFSIRGIVYGMFGFGATGTLLSYLTGTGGLTILVTALAMGAVCGALITALFNWLWATDAGHRAGDHGFEGRSGQVTLPISDGSAGTIAIERGSRRTTLRALPHETASGDPESWEKVFIVEMREGVARVTPVEGDPALES